MRDPRGYNIKNIMKYIDLMIHNDTITNRRAIFWEIDQTPKKCNIHFSGWEVGSCDSLFKPPKKCNIHFLGLSLQI